jgi:hypothetical protein
MPKINNPYKIKKQYEYDKFIKGIYGHWADNIAKEIDKEMLDILMKMK